MKCKYCHAYMMVEKKHNGMYTYICLDCGAKHVQGYRKGDDVWYKPTLKIKAG